MTSTPKLNPPRPGCKLDRLRSKLIKGATLKKLAFDLHWQPHTTRAAITRLRLRGYDIQKEKSARGGAIYKLRSPGAV